MWPVFNYPPEFCDKIISGSHTLYVYISFNFSLSMTNFDAKFNKIISLYLIGRWRFVSSLHLNNN